MRFVVAALAASLVASPAIAQDKVSPAASLQTVDYDDGWTIVPNPEDGFCTLARNYEDDSFLTVVFSASSQQTMIGIEVPGGQPYADGTDVTLDMMMVNDSDDRHTAGRWDGIQYSARNQDNGATTYYSTLLGTNLLNDLTAYELIGWHMDGKLLHALNLDGSQRAINTLVDCSNRAAGR